MKFSNILVELRKGKCIKRLSWNNKSFICKQLTATIPIENVEKMQSLPNHAKQLIAKLGVEEIQYHDQLIVVNEKGLITYYTPTGNDLLGLDWVVVDDKMTPNSNHAGDLMTFADWAEDCESGIFVDYDGYGYISDGKNCFSNRPIVPSELEELQEEFKYNGMSHILWFNR